MNEWLYLVVYGADKKQNSNIEYWQALTYEGTSFMRNEHGMIVIPPESFVCVSFKKPRCLSWCGNYCAKSVEDKMVAIWRA